MSGAILTTTNDRFALPEARAICDECRAFGPPVECRPLRSKRDVDDAALHLARLVSGFLMTWAYRPRKGGRRGGQVEHLLCRTCAKKRYCEAQREHGEALDACGGSVVLVMRLRGSLAYSERVAEMVRLRAYLGIPEEALGATASV